MVNYYLLFETLTLSQTSSFNSGSQLHYVQSLQFRSLRHRAIITWNIVIEQEFFYAQVSQDYYHCIVVFGH